MIESTIFKNIYIQETCSAIKGSGKEIDENIKSGLKWMCAILNYNWNVYHHLVNGNMQAERKEKEFSEGRKRLRKMREESLRYSCHETYFKNLLNY